VFIKYVIGGILAGLVLATTAAAGQKPTPQHVVQKDPAKEAQRGGPPGPGGVPQRFKWWQDDRIKADLHLAPEQSARIEEIFQASFTKMKDVVDELNRREEQLSNLISGNDVTETELLKQADQVESLRSSLNKARTLMLFKMRRVLSADQRAKLVEIQKVQERDRRGGRNGGQSHEQ
jgi:Spy/CpxP family protein refolding chaperone